MPEPLVCEDTSLSRLMETVHSTPGARVLYQDTVRRGGVLGFFAREVHRVAYLVDPSPAAAGVVTASAAQVVASAGPAAGSAAEGLLDAVEAAESRMQLSISHTPGAASQSAGLPDFASVLQRYVVETESAEEPVADKPAAVQELAVLPQQADAAQPDVDQPAAEVTLLTGRGRDARNRLEMLMQLRQVGVPVSLNPTAPVQGTHEALENILEQLPKPAELPSGAGEVLVIVGEGAPALHAARTVSRMLRLKVSAIVAAGLPTGLGAGLRKVSGPAEAGQLRVQLAEASTPTVVVVATDGGGAGPDDPWPSELVTAFAPATVWAVVDARWKSDDSHAHLARLPRAEALVVHSAELSASPATVWELELPIALLDDRRPTDFVWLGMLIGLVGGAARHRATA